MNYKGVEVEPAVVWNYFAEISAIPRPSKGEEHIRKYLVDFGCRHNLITKQDAAGNVLLVRKTRRTGTPLPAIILQSHMDMVCEQTAGKNHDFTKDPLDLQLTDDWVTADGTTLGADNGIGMAMQLAVLTAEINFNRDIECLFTVDEETGLTGAFALEENFFEAKTLINLDSEEDDEIFVGCAGGSDTTAFFYFQLEKIPQNYFFFEIKINGLKGGHSGDEIHKKLANANKLLNDFLLRSASKYDFYLCEIDGGLFRNAIAREGSAVCAIPYSEKERIRIDWNIFIAEMEDEWLQYEPMMHFFLGSTDRYENAVQKTIANNFLQAIAQCPHGVLKMCTDFEGLVHTSTNLASVKIKNNVIIVATNQRSLVQSDLQDAAKQVASCFEQYGAETTFGNEYPGWEPNFDSKMVKKAEKKYYSLFNEKPKVRIIHAGLECGLFLKKYPYLDMISIGPTILGVHSPEERVSVSSVQKTWKFLVELLLCE